MTTLAFDGLFTGKHQSIECGCGCTHFSARARHRWGNGEYERLESMARARPDKYVHHPEDEVLTVFRGPALYVKGCPCEGGNWLETFLWDNALGIATFFSARAQVEGAASPGIFVDNKKVNRMVEALMAAQVEEDLEAGSMVGRDGDG